jgi:hypothetical protein
MAMKVEPSLLTTARARRERARQRLYEVFGVYRLSEYGSPEGACPHCVGAERFEAIASSPLCELRFEDVWSYCSAVWPGVADFKYFLPRLLDVTDPVDPCADWEEVERKLPPGGWAACSPAEREVVAEYMVGVDELVRLTRASANADEAELLRPLIIRSRLASGLPLVAATWKELDERRVAGIVELTERARGAESVGAVVALARAVNSLLEREPVRAGLRKGRLSVVPENDPFMAWVLSGEAAECLGAAFERDLLDEESALWVGTALANVSDMTH